MRHSSSGPLFCKGMLLPQAFLVLNVSDDEACVESIIGVVSARPIITSDSVKRALTLNV